MLTVCNAIYIHIPFCIKKCNYCDFLSFDLNSKNISKYVEYLIKEIKMYGGEYDTIYIGGGTPSTLPLPQIKKIISSLKIKKNAEITMEINPQTVDKEYLQNLRDLGVNRLSIGVQSFNDETLKILGRIHNSYTAIKTYQMAREVGFTNISLDLMFSIPNQDISSVEMDLKKLLSLNPEHFSIYSLIWEENTPFYRYLESGKYSITDNELEAEMYEKIIEIAQENNYIHYEISNFAKEGYESRHNTKYWENKEYVGVGLGASGYFHNKRYKNCVQFSEYYDNIDKNIFPIMESENIDKKEKEIYYYILGLRLLQKGIIPKNEYISICEDLTREKLLEKRNNRYPLSKKGLLLANDVMSRFL